MSQVLFANRINILHRLIDTNTKGFDFQVVSKHLSQVNKGHSSESCDNKRTQADEE